MIWKEQYQREVKDVFAVQDDITRAIVGALQVRLASDAAPQATTSHGTTNLEAYDLYLRGLQLYRRRGAGLRQADTLLTKAIDLDPNFARAHAALASVLMVEPYYFNDVTIASVLPRSRAAAERAVAIDDGLAEAHQALGHVHTEAFEWAKAESELRRAVALNPSSAEAQFRLGFMLQYSGRTHEATTAFERAKSIDPFYPVSSAYLALSLALEGRKQEAISEAHRAIDLDSTSESVGSLYANALELADDCDEAKPFAQRKDRLTTNVRRQALYASVVAACGSPDDSMRWSAPSRGMVIWCSRTASVLRGTTRYAGVRASRRSRRSSISMRRGRCYRMAGGRANVDRQFAGYFNFGATTFAVAMTRSTSFSPVSSSFCAPTLSE